MRVVDPDTQQGWELRLRLERSETSGDLFDRMALRIEAIASSCGMKGIFKLLAADVYEVVSVGKVPEQPGQAPAASDRRALDAVFTMRALQHLTERINAAEGLEPLIDAILAGLDEVFGFSHSMILLPGEQPRTLITIATHGYPENGAGAEARFGGSHHRPRGRGAQADPHLRPHARHALRLRRARFRAEEAGWCSAERRIPLPGLANPASQLGVPLLLRGDRGCARHRERDAVPVPRRRQADDRAARRVSRDGNPERGAAGGE